MNTDLARVLRSALDREHVADALLALLVDLLRGRHGMGWRQVTLTTKFTTEMLSSLVTAETGMVKNDETAPATFNYNKNNNGATSNGS